MKKKIIFDESLKIITNSGLEGLSMRKLATNVGCTPSSLYNYFDDKNDLLNKLYLEIYCSSPVRDYSDKTIQEYFEYIINLICNYPDKYKFIKKYNNSSFLTKETKEKLLLNDEIKRKGIDKLFAKYEISEEREKLIGYMLSGTVSELIENKTITSNDISQIVDMLCYGILRRENE